MNPDRKTLWVDALRSGLYQQGKYRLKKNGHHCCLGVLCDVSGLGKWQEGIDGMHYEVSSESRIGSLPKAILEYAELSDRDQDDLWELNDSQGKTFAEIADFIDAHY